MKYSLFIVFLFIGISQGFLGSINQAINNAGNNIQSGINEATNQVDNAVQGATNEVGAAVENAVNEAEKEVEHVIGQLLDLANGIKFAANFLWDTVFSPAFDMIIQGIIHL
jgi:F0F1-type ATP synthase membrane subunit b/b'